MVIRVLLLYVLLYVILREWNITIQKDGWYVWLLLYRDNLCVVMDVVVGGYGLLYVVMDGYMWL